MKKYKKGDTVYYNNKRAEFLYYKNIKDGMFIIESETECFIKVNTKVITANISDIYVFKWDIKSIVRRLLHWFNL